LLWLKGLRLPFEFRIYLSYSFGDKGTFGLKVGCWRQKLMTNEKRVIAEAAAQCYLHEYDTEQAFNSQQV